MNQPSSSIEIEVVLTDPKYTPRYMTPGAAGADVCAYLNEPITLLPGRSTLVPTGIRMAIPEGFEVQVRPRSGLALKHQITVLNTPGTIDSDYRGEVGIILINHGTEPFIIVPGLRIAQLVLAPVFRASFTHRDEILATSRNQGGFGHTGSS